MKKTTYILCVLSLCTFSCLASYIHNEDEGVLNTSNQLISASQSEFKGDWTETFSLVKGYSITHRPNSISLDGSFGDHLTTGRAMSLKNYNGLPFSMHGLSVTINSTREEFVQALIRSGLYENQ